MMKEMMIRLIKNDKIVGYEWKLPYDDAIKLCTGYDEYCFPKEKWSGKIVSVDSVDMGHWVMVEDFTYDSFELGIKVGDEWWFENDIIHVNRHKYPARNEDAFDGILTFMDYEWMIYDMHSMGINGVRPHDDRVGERIGTIHDEGGE